MCVPGIPSGICLCHNQTPRAIEKRIIIKPNMWGRMYGVGHIRNCTLHCTAIWVFSKGCGHLTLSKTHPKIIIETSLTTIKCWSQRILVRVKYWNIILYFRANYFVTLVWQWLACPHVHCMVWPSSSPVLPAAMTPFCPHECPCSSSHVWTSLSHLSVTNTHAQHGTTFNNICCGIKMWAFTTVPRPSSGWWNNTVQKYIR